MVFPTQYNWFIDGRWGLFGYASMEWCSYDYYLFIYCASTWLPYKAEQKKQAKRTSQQCIERASQGKIILKSQKMGCLLCCWCSGPVAFSLSYEDCFMGTRKLGLLFSSSGIQ